MGIMGYVLLLLYVAQLRNHYRITSFSFEQEVVAMLVTYKASLLRLVTYKDVLIIAKTGVFYYPSHPHSFSVTLLRTVASLSHVIHFKHHLFTIRKV